MPLFQAPLTALLLVTFTATSRAQGLGRSCDSAIAAGPSINAFSDSIQLGAYAGRYRLRMVATAGLYQGDTVSGLLTLNPAPADHYATAIDGTIDDSAAATGTALINLWAVGAFPGPQAPGHGDTLTVRFGAPPGSPLIRFSDDSYHSTGNTWLHLFAVPADLVAGSWESEPDIVGGPPADTVSIAGWFCLQRLRE